MFIIINFINTWYIKLSLSVALYLNYFILNNYMVLRFLPDQLK